MRSTDESPMGPMTIISGGQTGVDRAGLDVALDLGLTYGGSIPKGRKAEDGPIDQKYENLTELASGEYRLRTKKNVMDADATLIITMGRPRGGTAHTLRVALSLDKPHLVVDLQTKEEAEVFEEIRGWLNRQRPRILNIAGPRESKVPGIYRMAYRLLRAVLSEEDR